MSGMFAIVVSGRLVQTDFQQVDVNKFLITVPNVDSINHIVVFMTGVQPLQPDMGASVHFSFPNPNNPITVWKYLGMISNDKPSAIFKISGLKEINPSECSGFYSNQQAVANFAQIGISVEPLIALNSQIPEISKNGNNQLVFESQLDKKLDPNSLMLFVQKAAESLFQHVASFATTIPGINEQIVPISAIESWYNSFKRKLEFRPDFWLNSN